MNCNCMVFTTQGIHAIQDLLCFQNQGKLSGYQDDFSKSFIHWHLSCWLLTEYDSYKPIIMSCNVFQFPNLKVHEIVQ